MIYFNIYRILRTNPRLAAVHGGFREREEEGEGSISDRKGSVSGFQVYVQFPSWDSG